MKKAQHQHADQTGPTRRQHGRNAGTAIDPRFEQHWHNQPPARRHQARTTTSRNRHLMPPPAHALYRHRPAPDRQKNATSRKISPHTTGISIRCTNCASVECGLLRWRIAMAISATAAPDEMPEKRNSTGRIGLLRNGYDFSADSRKPV